MTDKQRKFCEEYLTDSNATQAAIRAGYSERTAYSIGDENLKKPEIKKYIKELQDSLSEETKTTQTDLINELKAIGFAEIDINNIKPSDKLKALEIIARMLGLDKPETDEGDSVLKELLKEFKKI